MDCAGNEAKVQGFCIYLSVQRPEVYAGAILVPAPGDVTEDEFQLVTIENILSVGQYNDLGIQVRDKLILLVEAQSVFSVNIVLRMLMYLAATYKEYVAAHDISLYSTKPAAVPLAELYVVYTGAKEDVPDTLRLSDLCGKRGSVEVEVTVLCGGDDSILGQYVEFCKIADEQRELHGLTKLAIQETIRICQERGVLIPFLTARRKEVVDIMEILFSQEEIWEMTKREIIKDAKLEGKQEGKLEGAESRDVLYGELLKHLVPLGRISDLLAATSDKTKLMSLAQEFGLKM